VGSVVRLDDIAPQAPAVADRPAAAPRPVTNGLECFPTPAASARGATVGGAASAAGAGTRTATSTPGGSDIRREDLAQPLSMVSAEVHLVGDSVERVLHGLVGSRSSISETTVLAIPWTSLLSRRPHHWLTLVARRTSGAIGQPPPYTAPSVAAAFVLFLADGCCPPKLPPAGASVRLPAPALPTRTRPRGSTGRSLSS
jgi:hypothetical protein